MRDELAYIDIYEPDLDVWMDGSPNDWFCQRRQFVEMATPAPTHAAANFFDSSLRICLLFSPTFLSSNLLLDKIYITPMNLSLSPNCSFHTILLYQSEKKKEGNLEKEAVEMEKKQPSQWLLGKSPTWCELNKLEDRQTDRCCSSDSSSDKRKRPTYLSLSLNYYPFWTFLYSGHISRLLDSNPRLES